MIFKKIGKLLQQNTKPKLWWMKLGVSLVASNLFFYLLFGSHPPGTSAPAPIPGPLAGWVAVQIDAELQTPFQVGKKVLLINRDKRLKVEGVLDGERPEGDGKLTFLVHEKDAAVLFHYRNWEILPFLRHLTFKALTKGKTHEISY